jgi:hypothetical protein
MLGFLLLPLILLGLVLVSFYSVSAPVLTLLSFVFPPQVMLFRKKALSNHLRLLSGAPSAAPAPLLSASGAAVAASSSTPGPAPSAMSAAIAGILPHINTFF